MTIKGTYQQVESAAVERLKTDGQTESRRDVQLLLMAASGLTKSSLIARSAEFCPDAVIAEFEAMIERRLAGEPVYRIIGQREFHGLVLQLNSATLEPRDDTECLIELVLDRIEDRSQPMRFLDLGTGTGAIALALLSELPLATAWASDISQQALEMAGNNAALNGLENRIKLNCSNWFEQIEGRFDFIVSNPPYIETATVDRLAIEVLDHDPRRALDGGETGLDAYTAILNSAAGYLKVDGFLALEIGANQRRDVADLAQATGWMVLHHGQDLAGRDRAMVLAPCRQA